MPRGNKKNQIVELDNNEKHCIGDLIESSNNPRTKNDITKLSTADVQRLISNDSDRISFHIPEDANSNSIKGKVRAECWQKFRKILIDNKQSKFVKCNHCPTVLIYISKTGNSSLNRHDCTKEKGKKQISTNNMKMTNFSTKVVPPSAISELNSNIVAGLARDLRPLSSVERDGFKLIAQSLINIGAKYGHQSAANIVQDRTTLTRTHLPSLCEKLEENIRTDLKKAQSYPKLAFTKDMWSEKHNNSAFLSMTVHYINENWELKSASLGMDEFNDRKTTDNIRNDCKKMFGKFFELAEISSIIENSIFVTDGGYNMLNVFPNRKPCQCHRINLFVQWTFNNKPVPSEEEMAKKGTHIKKNKFFNITEKCPKIKNSQNGLRDLVTYFKQSDLNSQLSTTLKQDVVTRWNSQLISIESYIKVKDELKQLLLAKNKLHKIASINDDILVELAAFLKPIAECSEILSGDKYPTIQLVALFYHQLDMHIQITGDESHELMLLKQQAAECFKEYCVIDDFYYMACMLDPRYKLLKFATPANRQNAVNLLKTLMEKELEENGRKSSSAGPEPPPTVQTPRTKRKPSRFDNFLDGEEGPQDVPELDRYLVHVVRDTEDEDFDVLLFWRDVKEFPILKQVAQWVLAIPASEASDERTFSGAGQVKSPRRTQLGATSLSRLVFVHENFKMLTDSNSTKA